MKAVMSLVCQAPLPHLHPQRGQDWSKLCPQESGLGTESQHLHLFVLGNRDAHLMFVFWILYPLL